MSKYFQAMQRSQSATSVNGSSGSVPQLSESLQHSVVPALGPGSQDVLSDLWREGALHPLSERLAAPGAIAGPVRVFVTGCRSGDGASSVAAALALDMSQRLATRTILVESRLRLAVHQPLSGRTAPPARVPVAGASIAAQGTGWPRLERLSPETAPGPSKQAVADLCALLDAYPLAVIDMGVVRLDPIMLAMARPSDPILVIARYLHTDRKELSGTVSILRENGHTVAGVVLNAFRSPVPDFVRKLLGMEV
jgi:Mrp family chromosome partitioning ATPase